MQAVVHKNKHLHRKWFNVFQPQNRLYELACVNTKKISNNHVFDAYNRCMW